MNLIQRSSRRSRRRSSARTGGPRRIWSRLGWLGIALPLLPVALAVVFRFAPVPLTPLMLQRAAQGYGYHKDWVPLTAISPHLRHAVVAAEDNIFCAHNGFDWRYLSKAIEQWQAGESGHGGSTISMQVAKNLYLLPVRTAWRKALEFPLTALLEAMWPKQRILEVYLNIAEWGPGVYGAEAAARYHFNTSAKRLTREQAARLAAILPLPLKWSAKKPGPYVAARTRQILRRTHQLGPTYLGCTGYTQS